MSTMSKEVSPLDVDLLILRMEQAFHDCGSIAALHEPSFCGREWELVKDCLDTGWVSTAGKYGEMFERSLTEFTGVKSVTVTINGTAALHTCLILAGVTRDDEVIVPAMSFVATANAVTYCGAVPHFADSTFSTLGIDPDKLRDHLKQKCTLTELGCFNNETGRQLKAVVAMHVFGHPVALGRLAEVCAEFRLVLIEDAAQALGSIYKGKHVGHWGKLAALSFNGNKTITAGGGGAILTNDESLGALARHITCNAKVPHLFECKHDMIGYNYRLPNLNAALGFAQMEMLSQFLQQKRKLFETYQRVLGNISGLRLVGEPIDCQSNFWLNAVLLDSNVSKFRDQIILQAAAKGIMLRPVWQLMHRLPMYQQSPRMDLSVSEDLYHRLLMVPSSPCLAGYANA